MSDQSTISHVNPVLAGLAQKIKNRCRKIYKQQYQSRTPQKSEQNRSVIPIHRTCRAGFEKQSLVVLVWTEKWSIHDFEQFW